MGDKWGLNGINGDFHGLNGGLNGIYGGVNGGSQPWLGPPGGVADCVVGCHASLQVK